MATVGVKGLMQLFLSLIMCQSINLLFKSELHMSAFANFRSPDEMDTVER